jgi:hypothetical protein
VIIAVSYDCLDLTTNSSISSRVFIPVSGGLFVRMNGRANKCNLGPPGEKSPLSLIEPGWRAPTLPFCWRSVRPAGAARSGVRDGAALLREHGEADWPPLPHAQSTGSHLISLPRALINQEGEQPRNVGKEILVFVGELIDVSSINRNGTDDFFIGY